MYIGNGLVIHASMPGVPITVVPLDRAGPNAGGPPRAALIRGEPRRRSAVSPR